MKMRSTNRALATAFAKKQLGLTLIETVIALLIGAVVIAGAVIGYQVIYGSKAQNDAQLLSQAAQCARTTYNNSPDFSGANISTLAGNGCFPPANVSGSVGSQTVKDTNGYSITAAPTTLQTSNDSIAFTISAVPTSVCTQVLAALAPSASQLSAGPVGNGGANIVMPYGGTYNPSLVPQACGSSLNDIIYTITK